MLQSELTAAIARLPKEPIPGWNLDPKAAKLLRKAVDRIEDRPARLDMNIWGLRLNPEDKRSELFSNLYNRLSFSEAKRLAHNPPDCGTVACLGGNLLIVVGQVKARPAASGRIIIFPYDTQERCTRLLFGPLYSEDQAIALSRLFFVGTSAIASDEKWPRLLAYLYRKAKTDRQRVMVVKARVEYWIPTGR